MRLISEAGGRRPPLGRVPGPVMAGVGRFADLAQRLVPARLPLNYEGVWTIIHTGPFDASATVSDLRVEFRPAAETLCDAVEWLLEARRDGDRRGAHA